MTADVDDTAGEATEAQVDGYDARGVGVCSFAHFSHDMYTSFIGPLIPAIRDQLGIPLFLVSLMIPAQQMPSVFQPLIGYVADRTSRRWFVVLAPAIAAIAISSLGLAPNIATVLLLLLISGLASAMFHAPAVSLVGEYGGQRMGKAMSIFMSGGELSRTIGPLIITGAIALFTLRGSFVVAIFGIVASILLYFTLDTTGAEASQRDLEQPGFGALFRTRRRAVSAILAFSILIGIVTTPFNYFLVEFLIQRGHGEWYGGFALSTLFAAGIVGALVFGSLSDRIGRRPILLLLVATTPLLMSLYLWLENGSWLVLLVLALAGAAMMAPRTIILAMAAEVVPEARGPMAGMLLALGFVAQSIAALSFGALSDAVGISTAYWVVPFATFLCLPCVALMPRN
ncbi:MAG: MFS transporter [Thermomicrobiales bacterium]|nr:MFS transporter [Thermomicrobiales bacterium]